jgi:hypothetical protein
MKKLFLYIVIITTITQIISCKKEIIEDNETYQLLNPTRPDANAGTWRPILLTTANEFACATPIATTSPDYVLQLNEIKSFQNDITSEKRKLINYWGAGAVLRWNEIMRELVAKHNVPPYQNADGTYPIPNAGNPLAYPTFPFSNPPYAARAYAYLSAAQYDACIAAYFYKNQYNRAAPFNVDGSIQTLLPKSTLPSYPSEDAVVMGVSVELLKLLFPGDQDYINQKAEEHKRARLIAGANVRSDLDAGEALGKLVATKFITRARGDRAGAAVGTPTNMGCARNQYSSHGTNSMDKSRESKTPTNVAIIWKSKNIFIRFINDGYKHSTICTAIHFISTICNRACRGFKF